MTSDKTGFTWYVLCLQATLLFSLTGCARSHPDLESELAELARLQLQERAAHLEEQPALIVNMLSDTLIQVKNGKVDYFTKDQMTERFINYFDNVEFLKWEDTHPPVYTLSGDATLASILIRKIVVVNDVTGTAPVRDTTLFAWTELWKKTSGKWKLHQVTTTDDMD